MTDPDLIHKETHIFILPLVTLRATAATLQSVPEVACQLIFHMICQNGARPLCSSYPGTYIKLSDESHLYPSLLMLGDPNLLLWWKQRISSFQSPTILCDLVFPLGCSTYCFGASANSLVLTPCKYNGFLFTCLKF